MTVTESHWDLVCHMPLERWTDFAPSGQLAHWQWVLLAVQPEERATSRWVPKHVKQTVVHTTTLVHYCKLAGCFASGARLSEGLGGATLLCPSPLTACSSLTIRTLNYKTVVDTSEDDTSQDFHEAPLPAAAAAAATCGFSGLFCHFLQILSEASRGRSAA